MWAPQKGNKVSLSTPSTRIYVKCHLERLRNALLVEITGVALAILQARHYCEIETTAL